MKGYFVAFLFVMIVTGGLFGCLVDKDANENSGEDRARTGAVELPLERTVLDNVDRVGLDQTDWKYFSVPTAGLVEIIVAFDNVEARGKVRIREAHGLVLTSLEDQGEPLMRHSFKAEAGYYYLEVWCEQLTTDYTIEIHFTAL